MKLLGILTQLPWERRSTYRLVTRIKRRHEPDSEMALSFYQRFSSLPELTPDNISAFVANKHPELQGIDLSSLFFFEYDRACVGRNEVIYADYLMFFVKADTVKALHDIQESRRRELLRMVFERKADVNDEDCNKNDEGLSY